MEYKKNIFPILGSAKNYSSEMCTKIVRKLVFDKFLREEIERNAYGSSCYLKLGTNSHKLLNDFSKESVYIVSQVKKNPLSIESSEDIDENNSSDDELKRIEDDCFTELKTAISTNFPELKSVYAAMPITVYREIAQTMPENNEKLLEVGQMTHIRVQKYGKILLEVCQRFVEKKMSYLKDKLMAENLAREDSFEAMPSPTGNAPSGWIGKSS